MKQIYVGLCFLAGILFTGCASRHQIMFNVPKDYPLETQIQKAERNYAIQKNDLLELEVFTNKGERIVDPNLEIQKENQGSNTPAEIRNYLVTSNGTVKFPIIDLIKIESLTLAQAEEILQKEYSNYYKEPYVKLKYVNKRAIVLGTEGGLVVPLTYDNMKLTEVLALSKVIPVNVKTNEIRILRGDKIFVADLSTIDGYLKTDQIIEPGDIIYVEPSHRQLTIRDFYQVVNIVASITAIIIVLTK